MGMNYLTCFNFGSLWHLLPCFWCLYQYNTDIFNTYHTWWDKQFIVPKRGHSQNRYMQHEASSIIIVDSPKLLWHTKSKLYGKLDYVYSLIIHWSMSFSFYIKYFICDMDRCLHQKQTNILIRFGYISCYLLFESNKMPLYFRAP